MPEKIDHTALMSSAGAGKTRALTKRFLYLYLHRANYRLKSLYGITFTNEAAFEMKTRIMDYLDLLITGTSNDPTNMELIDHFKLFYPDIKQRAKIRKKHLLNNLAELNIYTFHSMFASFLSSIPFAAGVLPGYEIIDEANESILYETILDRYFEAGRQKEKQLEYMKEFVRQNEARIKKSIRNIYRSVIPWLDFLGDLVDREEKLITEAKLRDEDFLKTMQRFVTYIRKHEYAAYTKNNARMNKNIFGLCKAVDEFLESKAFNTLEKSEYTKAILRLDIINKRYFKKFVQGLGGAESDFEELLITLSSSTVEYLRSLSDRQIVAHLKPVLQIHSLFEKEKRARNLVSFDDIEMLTLRALKISPDLDYLYFKLGAEIGHLMIDEFQDTSYRQLEIIAPLISEILSLDPAEKSLFYVGDPKQAIYRWRGGASELFNVLIEQYPNKIKTRQLTINYRSKAEIVDFVNKVLGKEDKPDQGNVGGWVSAENVGEFEDDEHGQQKIIDRTAEVIKELIGDYNYEYSDIAVLVRTNNFGITLAEGLAKESIPHSSSSKCDLLSNADVRIIYRLLEFLDDPQNDFALLHVLLSPSFDLDEEVLRRLMHPGRTLFLCLRDAHPGWTATKKLEKLLAMVHLMTPYDLIFNIYQELQLDITYALATLLDIALDYTTEEAGHLSSFLKWLSDVGNAIQIKEMQPKGVQILTVHKAKGLEFDIVLLPETNWSLRSSEDPRLLFSYKTNGVEPEKIYWRRYGRYLSGLTEAEQRRLANDELNLLYVALTRARCGIHILGFHHKRRGLGFWLDRIAEKIGDSSFLKGEMVKKKIIKPEPVIIKEYGSIKSEATALKEERSLYSPTDRALELIDSSQRRGMEFGTIVHYALSNIMWLDGTEAESEVQDIVRRTCGKFARTHDQAAEFKEKLTPVLIDTLTDPDLRFLFFKDERNAECKNEVAIYFEEKEKDVSGQIDRLIIEPAKITIVDYKTGEMEVKHKQQVKVYKKGIEKIFHGRCIEAILVYLENIRGTKTVHL